MSPHSLHRDREGALWVTPLFNGIVARLQPDSGAWRVWPLRAADGRVPGIHDLPDVASAPYATTWDPLRRVVWIATSNGDVLYRFDPRDKSFGVLPLPRERAFLRMIDVDPESGVLITSYANIVENVQGPRMALIIGPGDRVYPKRFRVQP